MVQWSKSMMIPVEITATGRMTRDLFEVKTANVDSSKAKARF